MALLTNMLLRSFKIRASLAMPQDKMMHDKTSKICPMPKMMLAFL